MNYAETIANDAPGFLRFLKTRFMLIHASNLFYRDLLAGVVQYLHQKGTVVDSRTAGATTIALAGLLETRGIFKRIDHQTWLLNFPEFALPRQEKATA